MKLQKIKTDGVTIGYKALGLESKIEYSVFSGAKGWNIFYSSNIKYIASIKTLKDFRMWVACS